MHIVNDLCGSKKNFLFNHIFFSRKLLFDNLKVDIFVGIPHVL